MRLRATQASRNQLTILQFTGGRRILNSLKGNAEFGDGDWPGLSVECYIILSRAIYLIPSSIFDSDLLLTVIIHVRDGVIDHGTERDSRLLQRIGDKRGKSVSNYWDRAISTSFPTNR